MSGQCQVLGTPRLHVASAYEKTESTGETMTEREPDTIGPREPTPKMRCTAAGWPEGGSNCPCHLYLATAKAAWGAGTWGRHCSSCLPPHQTPSSLASHHSQIFAEDPHRLVTELGTWDTKINLPFKAKTPGWAGLLTWMPDQLLASRQPRNSQPQL